MHWQENSCRVHAGRLQPATHDVYMAAEHRLFHIDKDLQGMLKTEFACLDSSLHIYFLISIMQRRTFYCRPTFLKIPTTKPANLSQIVIPIPD